MSLIGWERGRLRTDLGFPKVILKHLRQSNWYEGLTDKFKNERAEIE